MIAPPLKILKPWTCVRQAVVGGSDDAVALLRANGRFASAVKLTLSRRGVVELVADIPRFPGHEAWVARAREEMAAWSGPRSGRASPSDPGAPDFSRPFDAGNAKAFPYGSAEEPSADLDRLDPDAMDRVFAAAEDAGFAPAIRAAGETCIPLGAVGKEVCFQSVADHPALFFVALGPLPENPACRRAVGGYALAVAAEVRLVRPSLLADGRLAWEVPLADSLPASLVAHALHALATVARVAGREIEDLAADPTLASDWMLCQQT